MSNFDPKQLRQQLAAQGAVWFFDNPTEEDECAKRACKGIATALQGAGLYRHDNGIYELQAYSGKLENGINQREWMREQWQQLLTANEPRAVFVDSGARYIGASASSFNLMVVVLFRIAEV